MRELTELENPNSVQQMKQWLADAVETDTLGKKAVAELVKTAPEPLREVLSLRQQLARRREKYAAMENAVCADGRAHGMFQFYGANRTGRFSGRLMRVENLPQNHMGDLAEARALVRSSSYRALSMLYEDITDTLSQLIRTAFVPQNGRKFMNSSLVWQRRRPTMRVISNPMMSGSLPDFTMTKAFPVRKKKSEMGCWRWLPPAREERLTSSLPNPSAVLPEIPRTVWNWCGSCWTKDSTSILKKKI